jgi:hypothetical protein
LLVFSDGLRDLALIQQLLRGFDILALVIGHSRSQTIRGPRLQEEISSVPSVGKADTSRAC